MRSILTSLFLFLLPAAAYAESLGPAARNTGVSGIWMLANISFAGMRAQNNPSAWRIVAFIFGFPGTLISFLAVGEGAERAYGIDIPKKRSV